MGAPLSDSALPVVLKSLITAEVMAIWCIFFLNRPTSSAAPLLPAAHSGLVGNPALQTDSKGTSA